MVSKSCLCLLLGNGLLLLLAEREGGADVETAKK
jgi:hypothetical protein